jgi:heme-degrading monooxygenase HmoA
MAIRHIVMWRVQGSDEAERARNARRVKDEFESLAGRIPGLLHIEVGIDESRIDYACDVVLLSDFDSRESLAAYASHPEHLRVRNALGDLRIARHQVDYEVHREAVAIDHGRSPMPAGASAGHPMPGDDHHVQAL